MDNMQWGIVEQEKKSTQSKFPHGCDFYSEDSVSLLCDIVLQKLIAVMKWITKWNNEWH